MISFPFWQRWLFVVGLMVSVFGIAMALLSGTQLFDLFNRQIDPAFWGVNAVDNAARQFQHWLYGVWGATIAGWGIILSFIAYYPFSKRVRWARNSLIIALAIWFVLDTSLSIFYKVYFNAAFNTVLLILAGLPVVFTWEEFK